MENSDLKSDDLEKRNSVELFSFSLLDEEIHKDETNSYLYYTRGRKYFQKGDFENALKDFGRALEIDHTFEEVHYSRAVLYYEQKKYLKAHEDVNQAIELGGDNNAPYFFLRGKIRKLLKKTEEAIQDFSRTIEVDPMFNDGVNFLLGTLHKAKGQLKLSRMFFTNQLKLTPEDPKVFFQRGLVLEKLGKMKSAVSDFENANKRISNEKHSQRIKNALERCQKKLKLSGIRKPLPKKKNPKDMGSYAAKKMIEDQKKKEVESPMTTVWHCSFDNSESGMMVTVGDSMAIIVDQNIREKLKQKELRFNKVAINQLFSSRSMKEIKYFLGDKKGSDFQSSVEKFQKVELFKSADNKEVRLTCDKVTPMEPSKRAQKTFTADHYLEGLSPEKRKDEVKRVERYMGLLEKAKTMDFEKLDLLKIVSTNIGKDRHGRPVILFKEQPFEKEEFETLLSYVVWKLDPWTNDQYVLVWCIDQGTGNVQLPSTQQQTTFGFKLLRKAYSSLCRKVRKNLKGFYLIHPSKFSQTIITLIRPFVSKKFWKKFHVCKTVQEVCKKGIDLHQCPLPPSTIFHDIQIRSESCVFPFFGVKIEKVMLRRDNVNHKIPAFLDSALNYLKPYIKKVGIFRIGGSNNLIKQMKLCVDHNYNLDFNHCDPHSVASLLKLWFREMPNSILRFEFYDDFLGLVDEVKPDGLYLRVKNIVKKLPMINYLIAEKMFKFLNLVSKHADVNKMDVKNIAICFSPNVLRTNVIDTRQLLKDSAKQTMIVDEMIVHAYDIFDDDILL